jgi:hypothetical protein
MNTSALFAAAHAAAKRAFGFGSYKVRFANGLRAAWAAAKAAAKAAAAPKMTKFVAGPALKKGGNATEKQFAYIQALVQQVGGVIEVSLSQFCRHFQSRTASTIITTLQAKQPVHLVF